jgi:hypothetical protein
MSSFLIIGVAALLTACLTLYSGFGLGTILMPVFALFFPIEVAVAATAVVHSANSIFKLAVVGKHADRTVIVRFGIPAIVASFAGAVMLGYVSHFGEIISYAIGSRIAVITPIKITMGALMLVFALFELLPGLRELKLDRKYLSAGGILSGFFGGFSGHQGALRSAFLAKVAISAEAFVGTNAIIGFMVDIARLIVYAVTFTRAEAAVPIDLGQLPLVVTGILAAFLGVVIGKRFLHMITMKTIQVLTGILLLIIALALGVGIV